MAAADWRNDQVGAGAIDEEKLAIDAEHPSKEEELLVSRDLSHREISCAGVLSRLKPPRASAMICVGLLLCTLVAVLSAWHLGAGSAAAADSAQAASIGAASSPSGSSSDLRAPRALLLDKAKGGSPGASRAGVVAEVYTYGAPAVSYPPIENFDREDRCFLGLRCYNEDQDGAQNMTRKVDAATIVNSYKHAKMPVAVLHWGQDSFYIPCPGAPELPLISGSISDWGLHWENSYLPRLQRVTVGGENYRMREPFFRSADHVVLAYRSYDDTSSTIRELSTRLPNWRLVAKEILVSGKGSFRDTDPVMIAQEQQTMDCALVFTGTNNGNELTTSEMSYATDYCGFHGVHVGYRNELWQITRALFPRLRPKLERCNRVMCIGHSMGGSLCELFAGCSNRKAVGDPDYEQQKWMQGTPELMPEVNPNEVQVIRH